MYLCTKQVGLLLEAHTECIQNLLSIMLSMYFHRHSTYIRMYIHFTQSLAHVHYVCQPVLIASTSDKKCRFGVPFKVLPKQVGLQVLSVPSEVLLVEDYSLYTSLSP